MAVRPKHIDLKREESLTLQWEDGLVSVFEVGFLRKMSPSADAKQLREEQQKNPLTVLPSQADVEKLTVENIELVGNYAIRVIFSDGHHTGIYSWQYLRSLDKQCPESKDG